MSSSFCSSDAPIRMDADTTARKGEHRRHLLELMQPWAVLGSGTQMIARAWISTDHSWRYQCRRSTCNLPLRGGRERNIGLLRAGRWSCRREEKSPGKIKSVRSCLIRLTIPAIVPAVTHDRQFCDAGLRERLAAPAFVSSSFGEAYLRKRSSPASANRMARSSTGTKLDFGQDKNFGLLEIV